VRHARGPALDQLEDVLGRLRQSPELREKSRGVFYRKSRAFLHFHEHGSDLYADVRQTDSEYLRLRVTTAQERVLFEQAVAEMLGALPG
jgi:hypothetical protein